MEEKIKASIETIRKYLQADGGDVTFISYDAATGVVGVRLEGACGGCPMATMTLKSLVEETVKKDVPEVKSVQAV